MNKVAYLEACRRSTASLLTSFRADALSGKTLTSFVQRNIYLGKAPDIVIIDGQIDRSARDEWEEKCFVDYPISYDDETHPYRPRHMIVINEKTADAVMKWWEPVTFTYPMPKSPYEELAKAEAALAAIQSEPISHPIFAERISRQRRPALKRVKTLRRVIKVLEAEKKGII